MKGDRLDGGRPRGLESEEKNVIFDVLEKVEPNK